VSWRHDNAPFDAGAHGESGRLQARFPSRTPVPGASPAAIPPSPVTGGGAGVGAIAAIGPHLPCEGRMSFAPARECVPGSFLPTSENRYRILTGRHSGRRHPGSLDAAPSTRVLHGAPDSAKARRLARPVSPGLSRCHSIRLLPNANARHGRATSKPSPGPMLLPVGRGRVWVGDGVANIAAAPAPLPTSPRNRGEEKLRPP